MAKVVTAPYKTGLQTNVEPFLLPDDGFDLLEDAFVWRGRVKRREGFTFLGRLHLTPKLPEALANVNTGAVTYTDTLASTPVSPGTVTIVISTAPPMTFTDNGNGTLTSVTATTNYGTIDYESGTFVLTFNPALPAGGPFAVNATAYRYLPRLSCMGLGLYEDPTVNREELIAFDEDYSYIYNGTTNVFDILLDNTGAVQIWSGTTSDFFWSTNYYQSPVIGGNYLFWATNNVANVVVGPQTQNGIQIYNGTAWYAQTPVIDAAANQLRGCLILLPYKNRMIALNTLEGAVAPAGATRHPNRARWSQNGVPFTDTLAGALPDAWREDIVGKGGYHDAPTREAITSAVLLKDTLIVFFERSTWRLTYTGNEILPFIWERINEELGVESTFSSVIFDRGVLGIGDKGVIAANSISVERIDEKIPQVAYSIQNDNDGPKRVHGIRDYYNKLVFWTFPSDLNPTDQQQSSVFPDKLLVMNYEEGNWALFNDSFTCFGYWQDTRDFTWATLPYSSWSSWTIPWGAPLSQSYFPNIISGNQKGFVLVLNQQIENDISRDITNITNANPAVVTIVNHNLQDGQFVKFYYTRGFTNAIVNENDGIAIATSTSFSGVLTNLGVYPSSVTITVGANTFTDIGNGSLIGGVGNGVVDYETGKFTVNFAALGVNTNVLSSYSYNVLNYRTFYVERIDSSRFYIWRVLANENYEGVDLSGYANPYTGSGSVSVPNNIRVRTKQFNPFSAEAYAVRANFFDVQLEKGTATFNAYIYADSDNVDPIETLTTSNIQYNNSLLANSKIWTRIYSNGVSDFLQVEFSFSDYQMTQFVNYSSAWTLHNLILDLVPSGRIINRS